MAVAKIKCTECGEATLVWDAYEASSTGDEDGAPTDTLCGSCFLEREYPEKKRKSSSPRLS